MRKRKFGIGGSIHEVVPASRQNIDQRTPSGVRPVSSPVIPVKSDVQGAMKHGGELKMSRSVKRMAVGGVPGPMDKRGSGGPGQGNKGPAPGGGRGPGRGNPGQGKGGAPGQGQGKGPAPGDQGQGKGPVPGGFMGGGKPDDMRYPMGAGGMPVGGGRGGMDPRVMELLASQVGRTGRAPGMKKGGKVSASSYRDMTGGAAGGIGRLEKSSIAAKTKSQKLKKGGKVKGYASGGPMTMEEIYAWNEKNNPDFKRPSAAKQETDRAELAEVRRSQSSYGKAPVEMFELPAPKKKPSGPKAIDPETGGTRMTPSQKRAAASEMGVTLDENRYGDSERGNGPGSYASTPNSRTAKKTESDNSTIRSQSAKSIARMIEIADANGNKAEVARLTKLNPEAASMAKLRPTYGNSERGNGPGEYKSYGDSERGNGSGATKSYGGSERGNGPGPSAKPKKSLAARQREAAMQLAREKGITDQGKIDDMIYRAQNMRRGGMAKMAKGGKAEAFEGSAKDMMQDKKLAKKRGMSLKAWEKSSADEKHDKQRNMKGLKKGGMSKMAAGGMSTSQDGMKAPLRPKPTAMAMGGYAKGGKAEMHDKGCKCMACGGMAKMAKGGKVGMTFGKPLPGTKVSSQKIRSTVSTDGANMKKDGMKGQLRAKASGAKATAMMKPLGMAKMAKGGKVRGAGIAQRGTKFIGEV
jgi:hypothetical protein